MATDARGGDDAPMPDVEAHPEPDTTTAAAAAAPEQAEQQPPQQSQGQDEEEAPASPPLPTRHTPVTPGPRAARLQKLYGETLHHALAKVAAWDNFAGCYPTVAARARLPPSFHARRVHARFMHPAPVAAPDPSRPDSAPPGCGRWSPLAAA